MEAKANRGLSGVPVAAALQPSVRRAEFVGALLQAAQAPQSSPPVLSARVCTRTADTATESYLSHAARSTVSLWRL